MVRQSNPRALKIERNQYQFANVDFRGGDSGGHYTTKLARWGKVGGGDTLNLRDRMRLYLYAVVLLFR